MQVDNKDLSEGPELETLEAYSVSFSSFLTHFTFYMKRLIGWQFRKKKLTCILADKS